MHTVILSIHRGPRSDPGYSVDRIETRSGAVQRIASFSERAAAIRFAAQVAAKTGWTFPTAQILPFQKGARA